MEGKNRYRFVIQVLVILVRTCVGIIWASAGPLLVLIMQAYDINRGSASWFASIAPLVIAVVAIPIGIYSTRYSLKMTYAVGAFFLAGGILAPFCNSYLPLLLTRVSFAIGTAITVPVASAIAAQWFSSRELPMANGIIMSFVNMGNAIGFVATVPIAVALSWKAPITIYGVVALACAFAWLIFGKDRRRAEIAKEAPISSAQKPKPELSARQVLTQRSTILLVLAVMGCWTLTNAMGAWLPTYYHQVFNMPLETASLITAIITCMGIVTCIIGGILPLRIGRRKPFLIIPGIFMGLLALSALWFNNLAVIIVTIVLFGIFSNLQTPSIFTIPFELPNISPRGGTIVVFAIQSVGNFGCFIGPLFVGYLADLTGSYLPGFIICAVFSLLMLVAGLMLPETGPIARKSGVEKAALPVLSVEESK